MDLDPINWYSEPVPVRNFFVPPTSAHYYPPPTQFVTPDDHTLPPPWKGVIDGATGRLYYWNPDTNHSQYDMPVYSIPCPSPYPSHSAAAYPPSVIASSDHVFRSHYPNLAPITYDPTYSAFPSFQPQNDGSPPIPTFQSPSTPIFVPQSTNAQYPSQAAAPNQFLHNPVAPNPNPQPDSTVQACLAAFQKFNHTLTTQMHKCQSQLQDSRVKLVQIRETYAKLRASATSTPSTPQYAPADPTLPAPWRGLINGSSGSLYYWNPETNATQYERPCEQTPLTFPSFDSDAHPSVISLSPSDETDGCDVPISVPALLVVAMNDTTTRTSVDLYCCKDLDLDLPTQGLAEDNSGCTSSLEEHNVINLEANTTTTGLQIFDAIIEVQIPNKEYELFDFNNSEFETTGIEIGGPSVVKEDDSGNSSDNGLKIETLPQSFPIAVAEELNLNSLEPKSDGFVASVDSPFHIGGACSMSLTSTKNLVSVVKAPIMCLMSLTTLAFGGSSSPEKHSDGFSVVQRDWKYDQSSFMVDEANSFTTEAVMTGSRSLPISTIGGSILISKNPYSTLSHGEVILGFNDNIYPVVVFEMSSEDVVVVFVENLNIVHDSMGLSTRNIEPESHNTEAVQSVDDPIPQLLPLQDAFCKPKFGLVCLVCKLGNFDVITPCFDPMIITTSFLHVGTGEDNCGPGVKYADLQLRTKMELDRICGKWKSKAHAVHVSLQSAKELFFTSREGLKLNNEMMICFATGHSDARFWPWLSCCFQFCHCETTTLLPCCGGAFTTMGLWSNLQVLSANGWRNILPTCLNHSNCAVAATTLLVYENLTGVLGYYHSMLALHMESSLKFHVLCSATVQLFVLIDYVLQCPNQDSSSVIVLGATYVKLQDGSYRLQVVVLNARFVCPLDNCCVCYDNHSARMMGLVMVHSFGEALTALHAWINDFSCLLGSRDNVSTSLGINVGNRLLVLIRFELIQAEAHVLNNHETFVLVPSFNIAWDFHIPEFEPAAGHFEVMSFIEEFLVLRCYFFKGTICSERRVCAKYLLCSTLDIVEFWSIVFHFIHQYPCFVHVHEFAELEIVLNHVEEAPGSLDWLADNSNALLLALKLGEVLSAYSLILGTLLPSHFTPSNFFFDDRLSHSFGEDFAKNFPCLYAMIMEVSHLSSSHDHKHGGFAVLLLPLRLPLFYMPLCLSYNDVQCMATVNILVMIFKALGMIVLVASVLVARDVASQSDNSSHESQNDAPAIATLLTFAACVPSASCSLYSPTYTMTPLQFGLAANVVGDNTLVTHIHIPVVMPPNAVLLIVVFWAVLHSLTMKFVILSHRLPISYNKALEVPSNSPHACHRQSAISHACDQPLPDVPPAKVASNLSYLADTNESSLVVLEHAVTLFNQAFTLPPAGSNFSNLRTSLFSRGEDLLGPIFYNLMLVGLVC
ncbi:uncharacterized protein LOC126794418 [Argentina anserina]|uniref:uncharacterized protein LOC126794418 n=1 Tax=Argentina anserina TaxID=57926 RepID=UPI0021761F77|nr:uncharacterized protein LOC126794418 [Potentilla anserina]